MSKAPSFLTNHELNLFLGGGGSGQRQYQRLRKAGLFPTPADLGKVHKARVALFPRFVLAGLTSDLATIPQATDVMEAAAAKVFHAPVFVKLRAAVLDVARALSAWNFGALVAGVVERAEDAVREWEEEVALAEGRLAQQLGISFSTEFGAIERVERDVCVISLDIGGIERVPLLRVATAHEEGRPVALERVNVLAKEIGYVMPLEVVEDQEERELAQWFAKMSSLDPTPAAIIESEDSFYQPFPYRWSQPREILWHGASTMTRAPLDK